MILFPKCGCCGDPDCKCPDPCAFGIRLTSPPEYATGDDYYGDPVCEFRNTCDFGIGVDDINDINAVQGGSAKGQPRVYDFINDGGNFCGLGYLYYTEYLTLTHGWFGDYYGFGVTDYFTVPLGTLRASLGRRVFLRDHPTSYTKVDISQSIQVQVKCAGRPQEILSHSVGTAPKGYSIIARHITVIWTDLDAGPDDMTGGSNTTRMSVTKEMEVYWNTGCTDAVRRSETCKAKPKQYDGYEDDLNTPGNTGDDKRPEPAPAFPWPMNISVYDDRVEVNGSSFSWLKTTTQYHPNAEESTSAQAVYDNACVRDFEATFQIRKRDCDRPGQGVERCCVLDSGDVSVYTECQCDGIVVTKPTQEPLDLDDATLTITACGLTATAPIDQWASGNEPEFSNGAGSGNGEGISVSCTPPNGTAFTATRFNFDVGNFGSYTACNANVVTFDINFSLINDSTSRTATCYLTAVYNDITGEIVVKKKPGFPNGSCCFEAMTGSLTASINIAP
jgi:hypothetical protein